MVNKMVPESNRIGEHFWRFKTLAYYGLLEKGNIVFTLFNTKPNWPEPMPYFHSKTPTVVSWKLYFYGTLS